MPTFAITCAAILVTLASASLPIPRRPLYGFVFDSADLTAPIHMDEFVDIVCSDCKHAYPVIKQVAEHYGPRVLRLASHQFPLPKHRNAYIAAKVADVMSTLSL